MRAKRATATPCQQQRTLYHSDLGLEQLGEDVEYGAEGRWRHDAEPLAQAFTIDRAELIDDDRSRLALEATGNAKRVRMGTGG